VGRFQNTYVFLKLDQWFKSYSMLNLDSIFKNRSVLESTHTRQTFSYFLGYIHFNRAMRWQGYLDFDEIWYGGSSQQNKNPF